MTAEGGRLGICTQDRTPHVAERSCNNWHPAAQPSESEREGARPIRCPDCHHTDHHDSVGCTYKGPPFGNPCRCTRKYWPTTKPDETYMDHPFAPAPPSPPSTGQSREPLAEVLRETVEGLQFYGRHLSTCAMKQRASFVTGHEEPPCTCGLEACVVAARRALESKP
jgi:hypothetical protein